jgi:hypothetical protein
VCVFITEVPITKLLVGGDGEIGGHVLRETTTRGLCGLVCPSRMKVQRDKDCYTEIWRYDLEIWVTLVLKEKKHRGEKV